MPLMMGSLAEWQAAKDGHLGSLLEAMRDRFGAARRLAPCILFIDEIDAFGDRSSFNSRHPDYSIQVVNGLLECLDGIGDREGVVVVAVCNRPGRLDPAIVRSGRLDRTVELQLPDQHGLVRIFRHHLDGDLVEADLSEAALEALGSTGADVARFVRDARRRARQENRPVVLGDLLTSIRGGPEADRRSLASRRTVAVHEAGRALLGTLDDPDRLIRVTIRADVCDSAWKKDPLVECAPGGGQDQASVLTPCRAY